MGIVLHKISNFNFRFSQLSNWRALTSQLEPEAAQASCDDVHRAWRRVAAAQGRHCQRRRAATRGLLGAQLEHHLPHVPAAGHVPEKGGSPS